MFYEIKEEKMKMNEEIVKNLNENISNNTHQKQLIPN